MPKVKVKLKTDSNGIKPIRTHWDDSFYVLAYEYSKMGMFNAEIAQRIGVHEQTFRKWIEERPALQEAIEKGRESKDESFSTYVFKHLPPDLKDLYKEIEDLDSQGDPLNRIQTLLNDHGTAVKQHLFLYAMVESDFNPSDALAKLHIHKGELDKWVRTDPQFGKLIEEIVFHKKNFLEGALFRLIARGDKSAVIFASKTLNSDRGYGNTVKVQHEGNVNHQHQIAVEDLPLTLEQKKQILRAAQVKQLQEPIEDAEYRIKGE